MREDGLNGRNFRREDSLSLKIPETVDNKEVDTFQNKIRENINEKINVLKIIEEMLDARDIPKEEKELYIQKSLETIRKAETIKGCSLDDFELKMHLHYWFQMSAERGGPDAIHWIYDPHLNLTTPTTVHAIVPENSPLAVEILTQYTENIDELLQQLKPKIDEILKLSEKYPILMYANHPNWSTILFTAFLLKKLDPDFDISRSKIVVGPVATTFWKDPICQKEILSGLGDVLVTIPSTGRRPSEISPLTIGRYIKKFGDDVQKNMKPGNIFFVEPSATTDRAGKPEEGEEDYLYMGPVDTSLKFLSDFNKKGVLVPQEFAMKGLWKNGGEAHTVPVQTFIGDPIYPGEFQYNSKDSKAAVQFLIHDRLNNLKTKDGKIVVQYNPEKFETLPKHF